jgi:hypothetical protein
MWWFLNHTGFLLAFSHRYGNLTILEFSYKWVKVMLPYREGGGLPVVGGGGSLMTHSAGSVTTQKKHSNMWWLLNHTGTPDISNRTWQVCHTLRFTFFKTLIALKLKTIWVWLKFSLIHSKFLGRYAKNWIFHQNNILQYFFSKSVHGYLTMRCVK